MSKKTVESRAVTIAAVIMEAAGLCRYEHRDLCRRRTCSAADCASCIRAWLMDKARSEVNDEQ